MPHNDPTHKVESGTVAPAPSDHPAIRAFAHAEIKMFVALTGGFRGTAARSGRLRASLGARSTGQPAPAMKGACDTAVLALIGLDDGEPCTPGKGRAGGVLNGHHRHGGPAVFGCPAPQCV